jgi:response regulator RpfG family c-di-GMP phosphodiesterase/serine/threonine protein kinase
MRTGDGTVQVRPVYPANPSFVPRPAKEERSSRPQGLLQELLSASLITHVSWEALAAQSREELLCCRDPEALLDELVERSLLTKYQATRIAAGTTYGLMLGNYRILDRLGVGAMGIVFKGEHRRLRKPVAIKILAFSSDEDAKRLQRFYAEMEAAAQLHHPNIVEALDAGEIAGRDPDAPILHYYVMEYVPGQDLETYVKGHGPLDLAMACDLAYQVASALAEAHLHDLVHRDIKPSNVLRTPKGQAKLLDFGIARRFRHRMTEPGTMLGTIDYLAPEQAKDASTVDIRADIYGLGGVLFWCLTGKPPFPSRGSVVEDLTARLTQPPPSVRTLRPDLPPAVDAILSRMLAPAPDNRYLTPQAVMRALLPFVQPDASTILPIPARPLPSPSWHQSPCAEGAARSRGQRVLIVDDDELLRALCRTALQSEGLRCEEATDGLSGLEAAQAAPFDLILLDIHMPGLNGDEVCRRLRANPPHPHVKIILFSGESACDDMAQMLLAGADDYLAKPFSLTQLRSRVHVALRLKEAQERSDLLNRHLLTVNAELEQNLTARDSDLVHARNALLLALAKLAENRHGESDAHLVRLQRYCRCLAEEAAALPTFTAQIDAHFIQMLECCVPLHDIGNVGLPDHILLHPGKLTPDERIIMQSHTLIGAETLHEVARQHGSAVAFLNMAVDIVRHHHERWDGTGYPDRLAGSAIPLAARLATLADVYDALRSRRVYKPALAHSVAVRMIADNSPGQFDPALLAVFQRCAPRFERIFRELAG